MPFIKRSFLVRLNFYAFVNVAVSAAALVVVTAALIVIPFIIPVVKAVILVFLLNKVNDGSAKKRDNK